MLNDAYIQLFSIHFLSLYTFPHLSPPNLTLIPRLAAVFLSEKNWVSQASLRTLGITLNTSSFLDFRATSSHYPSLLLVPDLSQPITTQTCERTIDNDFFLFPRRTAFDQRNEKENLLLSILQLTSFLQFWSMYLAYIILSASAPGYS